VRATCQLGSMTKRLGDLTYSEADNRLDLRNFATRLLPNCFTYGYSGDEKKDGETRGKFGDGLPSSTLVFTRNSDSPEVSGGKLRIFSCGHEYDFRMHDRDGARHLFMYVKREEEENQDLEPDTHVMIRGGHCAQMKQKCSFFDESRYLFLQSDTEKIYPRPGFVATGWEVSAEILKGDRHQGCIYVKGMLVRKGG
jgi:hypothetical protein